MPATAARARRAEATRAFGLWPRVSGVGGTVLGGWLGDRLLPRLPSAYFLVSGIGLALSVPCAAAVILLQDRAWVLGAIFLAETCIFLNTGPLNAIIANVSRPEVRATAFAANIFIIHALGEMGIGVQIDNFGAGAASLQNLRRFPVSGLKIDPLFYPATAGLASIELAAGRPNVLRLDDEGLAVLRLSRAGGRAAFRIEGPADGGGLFAWAGSGPSGPRLRLVTGPGR